jgi:hypothetical protein
VKIFRNVCFRVYLTLTTPIWLSETQYSPAGIKSLLININLCLLSDQANYETRMRIYNHTGLLLQPLCQAKATQTPVNTRKRGAQTNITVRKAINERNVCTFVLSAVILVVFSLTLRVQTYPEMFKTTKFSTLLPLARDVGEVSYTLQPYYPRERAPGTHWIGGCVDPRAGLDAAWNRTGAVQSVAIPTPWSKKPEWKVSQLLSPAGSVANDEDTFTDSLF